MLAFTVAYKIFLLSLLSQKRLKNVKYLTEGGRGEYDLLLWCLRKETRFIQYHLPWATRAEVWSVRGDRLWFGFFPCFFLCWTSLHQLQIKRGWWSRVGRGCPESILTQATATALHCCLGNIRQSCPHIPQTDFLKPHGISSAVTESC